MNLPGGMGLVPHMVCKTMLAPLDSGAVGSIPTIPLQKEKERHENGN